MSDDGKPGLSGRAMMGIGGLQIGCLVTGLIVGLLLDDALDSYPTGTLIGVGSGIVLAIVGSWLRIRKFLS